METAVQLVWLSHLHLASYGAAPERGWSADNRGATFQAKS